MGTHPIFESDFDCLTGGELWAATHFTPALMMAAISTRGSWRTTNRQQRRMAKLNSFFQRQYPNSCQMEAFALEKCQRDMVTMKGAQYGMFQAMTGEVLPAQW